MNIYSNQFWNISDSKISLGWQLHLSLPWCSRKMLVICAIDGKSLSSLETLLNLITSLQGLLVYSLVNTIVKIMAHLQMLYTHLEDQQVLLPHNLSSGGNHFHFSIVHVAVLFKFQIRVKNLIQHEMENGLRYASGPIHQQFGYIFIHVIYRQSPIFLSLPKSLF